jgi:hypothetical protein
VALFVRRVQVVRSEFTIADNNAPTVVEICRHLDGVAVDVKLMAARRRKTLVVCHNCHLDIQHGRPKAHNEKQHPIGSKEIRV